MAEVNNPTYQGVDVRHPEIVAAGENMARRGIDKNRAVKLLGMPREVVDRIYREANEKK